ncbi:MAG: polysaccharide biosynthesis protein, partial [Erysipelotrichaceae bacterium]|nr:polysaccharide biosynthesis protein [Erysipelotrichaceae bacterium]
MKKNFEHWQIVTAFLMIYDLMAVAASYFIALLLRFDFRYSTIQGNYLSTYISSVFIYAIFVIVIFRCFKLYRSIWRFASYRELLRMINATVITGIAYPLVMAVIHLRMPISYYVFGIVIQFLLTLGIRFSYRFILLLRGRNNDSEHKKNVMLIGAGSAGQIVFRDIKAAKEINEKVCCFIDDNPNKWNRYIDDVIIYGGRESILEAVDKYKIEKIYLSIPSASPKDKRDILAICNETGCELMSLPGMYQLYTGEVMVSQMKPVKIEDLLGRDPIRIDTDEVFKYISNKKVLVTGVGSIGSELSRQIAAHN